MTPTAGDRYIQFVLEQIEKARARLSVVTQAAEQAADRIVRQNGEYLIAGDDGFAGDPVWRAGGIAFLKRYRPDKKVRAATPGEAPPKSSLYNDEFMAIQRTADYEDIFNIRDAHANDVVLLGYESERHERELLPSYLQQLLSSGALVVLFGSDRLAGEVKSRFGTPDNCLFISHDVPDGGILDIAGWPGKLCSGRSFVQRMHVWLFQAELIGAFLRRGKIPGVLLSITYESPQFFNLPLIHSYRFIPAFDVTPVEEGKFGGTYLDKVKGIVGAMFAEQAAQFRRSAQWLASALRDHHKVYTLVTHGVTPLSLSGNTELFKFYSDPNVYYPEVEKEFTKDDVVLYVGYNWYPAELPAAVEKAGGRVILTLAVVKDLPPRAVIYGPGGPLFHPTSLAQLPQRENWIYIDSKFAQYDGSLKIPGYPVPAVCTSDLTCNMLYWRFLADAAELVSA